MICAICAVGFVSGKAICAIYAVKLVSGKMICAISPVWLEMICAVFAVDMSGNVMART